MSILKNMSVQQKIFAVLLPSLAIIFITATMIIYTGQRDLITTTQESMIAGTVDKTEQELQVWIDDKITDAKRFAELPIVKDACRGVNLDAAQKMLADLLAVSNEYENLFIAEPGGRLYLAGAGQATIGQINISKIPVYAENARQAQAGKPWISNAGMSPASGRPVALITTPIFDGNEVIGILGTPVELMVFSDKYITDYKLGESGYMYIIDHEGLVLAYPDKSQILSLNLTDHDFGSKMLAMKNGQFNYLWKGKDVIVRFKTNPTTNWMIALRQETDEFLADVRFMGMVLGLIGVVLIAVAAVLVWLSTRNVVVTLKKTVLMLKDIAQGEGDLTQRLEVKSNDEIGDMAKWFNTFVDKLHSVIGQVKTSTEQVTTAAQEISATSEELASGAEEQQSQTSEVAASMEEMAATILQSSSNTNNASDSAKKAADVASNGGGIVQETITGMGRISDAVRSSAQRIEELGQQSEEIGKIIAVIDDIADQTNLLALNANIEAARAGDQGRGFAVVADEVRVLAERTTKATAEIAEMINGIQGSTNTAVTAMDDGIKEVETGVDMAGKAGSALEEIIAVVNDVDSVITQVAAAAEEQSAGAEEISANVEGISTVTKQSAGSAQQMASAAQQLSKEAESLDGLVSQFKL